MKAPKDALDLAHKFLPMFQKSKSKEQEELNQLLNTAARAGAGGTRPGLFGIRPMGLKKASDLVDYFTPGKLGKPDRPFSKPVPEPEGKRAATQLDGKIAIVLPRHFCPDCGKKGLPEEGGAINISAWTEDRPDLGIHANEAMISFFCQKCCEKFNADIKDPGKDICEATVHGIRQRRQAEHAERLVRVKRNQEGYIHAMRMANRNEIYTDGRTT